MLQHNYFLIPLIAVSGTFSSLTPALAEDVTFRAECRKTSDRGCSANSFGIYNAPKGRYIEVDSVTSGAVVNYWKKEPRCHKPELEGRINYTIPGTTATATFYTSFRAPLHVQSGSGGRDIGKVAFVNCKYSFRLGKLP